MSLLFKILCVPKIFHIYPSKRKKNPHTHTYKKQRNFLTCFKIFPVKSLSGLKIHLLKALKYNIVQFLCKNNWLTGEKMEIWKSILNKTPAYLVDGTECREGMSQARVSLRQASLSAVSAFETEYWKEPNLGPDLQATLLQGLKPGFSKIKKHI